MTDDLERRLRATFSAPAATRERLVQSALSSAGRRRRPPAALVVALGLLAGLVGSLALRQPSPEGEPVVLTISNSERVITMVAPSGHVWLVNAGSARERSGGGVILNLGDHE